MSNENPGPDEIEYHVSDLEKRLDADLANHSRTTLSDDEWAALLASHDNPNTICHMYLCEATHLLLRPNQLYNFTVDPTCKLCITLARIAAGADGKDVTI